MPIESDLSRREFLKLIAAGAVSAAVPSGFGSVVAEEPSLNWFERESDSEWFGIWLGRTISHYGGLEFHKYDLRKLSTTWHELPGEISAIIDAGNRTEIESVLMSREVLARINSLRQVCYETGVILRQNFHFNKFLDVAPAFDQLIGCFDYLENSQSFLPAAAEVGKNRLQQLVNKLVQDVAVDVNGGFGEYLSRKGESSIVTEFGLGEADPELSESERAESLEKFQNQQEPLLKTTIGFYERVFPIAASLFKRVRVEKNVADTGREVGGYASRGDRTIVLGPNDYERGLSHETKHMFQINDVGLYLREGISEEFNNLDLVEGVKYFHKVAETARKVVEMGIELAADPETNRKLITRQYEYQFSAADVEMLIDLVLRLDVKIANREGLIVGARDKINIDPEGKYRLYLNQMPETGALLIGLMASVNGDGAAKDKLGGDGILELRQFQRKGYAQIIHALVDPARSFVELMFPRITDEGKESTDLATRTSKVMNEADFAFWELASGGESSAKDLREGNLYPYLAMSIEQLNASDYYHVQQWIRSQVYPRVEFSSQVEVQQRFSEIKAAVEPYLDGNVHSKWNMFLLELSEYYLMPLVFNSYARVDDGYVALIREHVKDYFPIYILRELNGDLQTMEKWTQKKRIGYGDTLPDNAAYELSEWIRILNE